MSARRKPAANGPLSKQRLRLWIRILRTARAIEAEVRERLRVEFGVTLPQFDVMAALERKPAGMKMSELSRFLMVSNGNVTGIIDRLAADKLVTRKAPDHDRRAIVANCEEPCGFGRADHRKDRKKRLRGTYFVGQGQSWRPADHA